VEPSILRYTRNSFRGAPTRHLAYIDCCTSKKLVEYRTLCISDIVGNL